MLPDPLAHPSRLIKGLGWRPQLPDHRDHLFLKAAPPSDQPDATDNRNQTYMPAIYDQGPASTCTGNGGARVGQWIVGRQGLQPLGPAHNPSRLFLYWNTRWLEGTTGYDSGATIRDTIKAMATYGMCDESEWPYDLSMLNVQPPQPVYTDAAHHLALQYSAVDQTAEAIQGALAGGYLVIFGFSVYESFMNGSVGQTGVMQVPALSEALVGGHCVVACDYDTRPSQELGTEPFLWCANSWGPHWGENGYFRMPYSVALNPDMASDFWVVELAE